VYLTAVYLKARPDQTVGLLDSWPDRERAWRARSGPAADRRPRPCRPLVPRPGCERLAGAPVPAVISGWLAVRGRLLCRSWPSTALIRRCLAGARRSAP